MKWNLELLVMTEMRQRLWAAVRALLFRLCIDPDENLRFNRYKQFYHPLHPAPTHRSTLHYIDRSLLPTIFNVTFSNTPSGPEVVGAV
jgi:hypothetical protein